MSKTHIAPNRLHIEAQILLHKSYKEQPSFYLVSLLVLNSSPIIGYDRMKGAEQGNTIDLIISISDWNQLALNDEDIVSFDVQKVSMNLWRRVE